MPEEYKKLLLEKAKAGDPHSKGTLFEQYSTEFFADEYFSIVRYTPRREDIPDRKCEEAKHPDFLYRDRKTNERFWVECKFRSQLYSSKYEITKYKSKFEEYKRIRKEYDCKLFFILGLYGEADYPYYVFLLDLDNLSYYTPYYNQLTKYCVWNDNSGIRFQSLEEIIQFTNGEQNNCFK